jgi:hypothetical protein
MEWSEQGMRLARLGRLDEARAAAARALELLPAFRYSSQFGGVNYAPALAGVLGGTPDCQSSLANCRDVFSLARDAPLSIEVVRPLRAVSVIWRS